MVKNYINFLQFVTTFIFLTFLSSKIHAQCAGNDNTNELICNISDPANRSISLFSLLGGNPVPGGTWSDDDGSRGLDTATGILSAQIIRSGGTYHYTYTAPVTAGCTDNKATVTLTIGAYAGVAAPYASECSNKKTFNLFTAFNGTVMGPHLNGIWTDSDGETVDSTIPIEGLSGTFTFNYTVPAVLLCSPVSPSVTVIVTINKAPEAGETNDAFICETDVANYTNFDLNTLISGQDPEGQWTGMGLSSPTDHIVDIQDLYNKNGPRTFTYTYKAFFVPSNNNNGVVCPDDEESLVISIEKKLDFTGAKVKIENDICAPEIPRAFYTARITQGTQAIPDGQYRVRFNVSGPDSGTETVVSYFVNGIAIFPISREYFKQVGDYTVTIEYIYLSSTRGACINIINDLSDVLHVYPLPDLNTVELLANPVCQNEIATVQITNGTQLADGNYDIQYNITGDNVATGQSANFTMSGGNASFDIPAILSAKSGAVTITITNITNTATGCTNSAFKSVNLTINPLPNATTVSVAVNNFCLNEPFPVSISGLGNLTNAKISYILSEGNSSTMQTITQDVADGKLDFVIPAELLLNAGTTKITLLNLTNILTNCDVDLINIADDFIIYPIPAAPAVLNQEFCKVDEAAVANLVPNGNQYKWYSSPTSTTPLASALILESGNYYVKETSSEGCTSEAATVVVTINDSPAPVLNSDGQNFCGLNNPTIADLSNNTNIPQAVAWYDAPENGNLLSATTPLMEQGRYYGFNFPSTDCFSTEYIEVTVTLTNCDNIPNNFFVPDGFSPNGDGVNDSFVIKDIEFLYPNYTLEIYNRYGNGMYKGDKNKPAWDGMNYEKSGLAGGVAPNGVYFYVLHFNKDNKPPQQGRLYLNR
ncbi:gliding motility-associated C-terminal domain-containing protein [Flavobacterium sp. ACN6]|uniref:gliding motility-associated C-terminal domain-containing protein n=1 Tax=Flavobacterium sp. ACN6 TaxID=1920426 RepID=UPI000BB37A5E|nr:gliding motility-associated C-terminal domain-containing protein [Flavobacterium sp. ACN6]PBJ12179.1 hypothetical protein BSF42_21340 [Flavobacterium sp. ACN6]